jgi:hypothetical protein
VRDEAHFVVLVLLGSVFLLSSLGVVWVWEWVGDCLGVVFSKAVLLLALATVESQTSITRGRVEVVDVGCLQRKE